MNKKKIIQLISWEIYPFDVLFVSGVTEKEIIDHISKKYEYKLDEVEALRLDFSTKKGKTVMLKNGTTILWVWNKDDIGVIAHEVFHVVDFLFEKIGITHSDDSDEAWAYAIEYLVKKIVKVVN